jgi:hypothetical protein
MTQEQIIAVNKATEQDTDWVKEERLEEVRIREMLRSRSHRPQWNREEQPGEKLGEVIRGNAVAAEVETHRYDEQNN